jgi:hypothetical protein
MAMFDAKVPAPAPADVGTSTKYFLRFADYDRRVLLIYSGEPLGLLADALPRSFQNPTTRREIATRHVPPRPTCGSNKHTPLRHLTRCHVGQSTHPHEAVKTTVKKGNGNLGGEKVVAQQKRGEPQRVPRLDDSGTRVVRHGPDPGEKQRSEQKIKLGEKRLLGYDG